MVNTSGWPMVSVIEDRGGERRCDGEDLTKRKKSRKSDGERHLGETREGRETDGRNGEEEEEEDSLVPTDCQLSNSVHSVAISCQIRIWGYRSQARVGIIYARGRSWREILARRVGNS